MEGMSAAFVATLKNNREKLNTKFAYARHAYPKLDGDVVLAHLRTLVEPIAAAVERSDREKTEEIVLTVYDFLLELLGKGLLGTETRYPALFKAWSHLFIQLPHLLIQNPSLFVASVSNAIYNLSTNLGTRPTYWIDEMIRIGAKCKEVAQFLAAGEIVAWRSGMAHFRESALDACLTLDDKLGKSALCIPEDNLLPVDLIVFKMRNDPWLAPWSASTDNHRPKALRIASVVGAFRGFGGLFTSPPEVFTSSGDFYVFDNQNCWLMTADLFGATLHKRGTDLPDEDKKVVIDYEIDKKGKVTRFGQEVILPELASSSSVAANKTTLAVTVPHSFGIYLIALKES
ncbi:MAG: hypothetical protein AB1757_15785 [Acidobacteriota bacterium]